MLIKHESLAMV